MIWFPPNFHSMMGYTVAINTCTQSIYTKLHGYGRLTSREVSLQLDKWDKMYLLTPMTKSIAFLGHMSSMDCSVKLAKKCSTTFILEHDSYSITQLITCLWIWFGNWRTYLGNVMNVKTMLWNPTHCIFITCYSNSNFKLLVPSHDQVTYISCDRKCTKTATNTIAQ